MPRRKIHIIRSPRFIQAVEKNIKTLLSTPFLAVAFPRLLGVSPQAMHRFERKVTGKCSDWGLLNEALHYFATQMKPGLHTMK